MKNQILTSVFVSIIIFTTVTLAQPQWYEQDSGVNRELFDVCFVDQTNGWISGVTETMLHTTDGGATWTSQNILPNNVYYTVFFTDLLNGWATGDGGKIVHSTDGGETWFDQVDPYTTNYYGSSFINPNMGWLAGGDAGGFPTYIPHRAILNTTNGGATWNVQYSAAYESLLRSIQMVDQNIGYAVGENGIIMKTTNGGTNWLQQTVISSFHLFDVYFASSTNGWVIGEYLGVPHYGAIFKTTDGGVNWSETSLGVDESLGGIYFTDMMHGWAVGGSPSIGGTIYYTSDGGANWIQQNIPSVEFLYKVFFVDETHGWASGHLGTIIATESTVPVEFTSFSAIADQYNVTLSWSTSTETNNSGFEILRSAQTDNWEKIGFVEGQGTSTQENNYSFVDENLGVGNFSYKLVQIDFDGTRTESDVVKVEINSLPAEYDLSQNYPNPFNPSTTIKYTIPSGEFVNLRVFNSIGEEVKTLVNEYKTEGTHEVKFDAADLSSGIYFYKIDAGKFSSIKKMILLK
jgi:photosystem II stability/assembly factor-like uncharacterized protein